MRNLFKRYLVFILGIYFLALGVVLFVISSLGTTPISSVNYILSLHFPLTLGMATFLFNMTLIAVELWLVHGIGTRKDNIEILIQIPVSFLLGAFMDLNMAMLSWIHVTHYAQSLVLLALGCVIQSAGVVLEIKPDVAAMSAEGVVKHASRRYHREFGKTKVVFDVMLVSIAAVLSVGLSGHIEGLREGTVVAALCTGYIVSFLSAHVITRRNFYRLKKRLLPHRAQ